MKKSFYAIPFICALTFITSCSEDSVTDEFSDVNGNVQEKLIKSVTVISDQDAEENKEIVLSYTTDRQLNTITDGSDTSIFIYEDTGLSTITGGGSDNLNIEELYESPYDAFESGDVLVYDDNGNPKKIEFYEEEYDYNTGTEIIKVYTADISYDTKHNPYFYTLKSGGIIDVLDGIQLNFSMSPQAEEIVQARMLFPSKNPSQIIYKNQEGETLFTINANYTYDNANYPTSAIVTAVSLEDSEQSTFSALFEYVD
jgi:hypothetical protein